jgi:hypothetical protein
MTEISRFLTTPIFFLTPYIFMWSILNGLIIIGLLRLFKIHLSRAALMTTALTTTMASVLWNWSIEFNQATLYLNVDHPIFRVSWADALNSVCVFALTSFILGLFVCKRESAQRIARVAGLAALVTLITDTFLF